MSKKNIMVTVIAIFMLNMISIKHANAKQQLNIEEFAYRTYVSCLNQHFLMSEKDYDSGLSFTLDQCLDLSVEVLDRSSSPTAARYLAYMELLFVDGGYSAVLESIVKKKGSSVKPYLLEARKRAGDANCLAPGIKLNEKIISPRLCVDKSNALKSIDENLGRIAKTASQKNRKAARSKTISDK